LASASPLDLVTGAFSYSGSHIARRLLGAGHRVRTLSFHPQRSHPLQASVQALAYRFDDRAALARSLDGVSTLYNTYWVRFDHGKTSFEQAIERSRLLFSAAREAGVARIVHVSITNPSEDSPLPYFRGKALVERALAEAGVPYSVVRPTLIFGGENDVLLNNIAWILRRMPVFALPGSGSYLVQPVHVEDVARICTESVLGTENVVVDAAGPDVLAFADLVRLIRRSTGSRSFVVNVPTRVMRLAARALGLLVGDVVLTADEIAGLMAGLLVSHHPALGQIGVRTWLEDAGASIGSRYANELQRHFRALGAPRSDQA
jgi:NADH dehydrogenase